MLDVHRIHALLASVPAAQVLEELKNVLGDDDLDQDEAERLSGLIYNERDDGEAAVAVRSMLNYVVKPSRRSGLIDVVEVAVDQVSDPGRWYADATGLVRLADEGMIIGSHSVSHRAMAQLSSAEQATEIHDSFHWIESVLGPSRSPRTFCYPYGGFHTFTDETERLLSDSGVEWSFNVENREVTDEDLMTRPQALPRADCCDLPHGQSRLYC